MWPLLSTAACDVHVYVHEAWCNHLASRVQHKDTGPEPPSMRVLRRRPHTHTATRCHQHTPIRGCKRCNKGVRWVQQRHDGGARHQHLPTAKGRWRVHLATADENHRRGSWLSPTHTQRHANKSNQCNPSHTLRHARTYWTAGREVGMKGGPPKPLEEGPEFGRAHEASESLKSKVWQPSQTRVRPARRHQTRQSTSIASE